MKIKKAIARAENPIQGNTRIEREQIEQAHLLQNKILEGGMHVNKLNKSSKPEMAQFQKEQLLARID